ncbi:hypothetical protein [Geobacter anodireducens]
MINVVVIVAIGNYILLLPNLIRSILGLNKYVNILIITNSTKEAEEYLNVSNIKGNISISQANYINELPHDIATQGCATKLAVWRYLDTSVNNALIVDADVVFLRQTEDSILNINLGQNMQFAAAIDRYVGYKEKIGEEFSWIKQNWVPRYVNGERLYVNTGIIFASRKVRRFFENVLSLWKHYIRMIGNNPSIWDQNIFNYCLDIGTYGCSWENVNVLPVEYNYLKEYDACVELDEHGLLKGDNYIKALHFNGGTLLQKYTRASKLHQLEI